MQRKTISLVLCLAMVVSMFAVSFSAEAVTVDSGSSVGVSKIERAGDFSWDNANVYFLLTDRFYNGNTANDHSYGRTLDKNGNPLSGWDTAPCTFHGGDFAGITQKLNENYFTDLGVNAIWISAPYEQIHGYVTSGDAGYAHYSYHGYYVLDYTETDKNFGTREEFKTMVDTAHSKGIRVVMDIVMNHAGYNNILDMNEYGYGTVTDRDAFTDCQYSLTNAGAFHNYINYEEDKGGLASDWGKWWSNDWIRSGVAGYTGGTGGDDVTKCLEGLPDFRTESTKTVSIPPILQTKWQKEGTLSQKQSKYSSCNTVSDYLTTWLAEWVETYGIDGFRCDTAKHVELASWKKLKTKCVTALRNWRQNNPAAEGAEWDEDFWMTGECWGYRDGYGSYYTDGGFDSMISFKITSQPSANPSGMPGADSINSLYASTAADVNSRDDYNLLTYISSHDTGLSRNNPAWQGTALQLMPGGVQIFYGDETARPLVNGFPVGGDGHAVRSDMNFGQHADYLTHWQKVGQFRNNHVAVGAGDHQQITAYNAATGYTFARTYSDDNVTDGVICCIGAPANTSIAVDVSSLFGNGKTVTNEYDRTTAVVQNGKATFNSGAQGVILISGPQPTIAMSLKGGKAAFVDTQTVTLSLRGAENATVKIADQTPFSALDGQTITMGEGIEVGTTFTVTLTATNTQETLEKTYTYKKKDPNAVTNIYFDNTKYNWSKVKAYVYDDTVTPTVINDLWPGEDMQYDSATGLYVYEVPDELVDTGLVIFTDEQNQYPAAKEKGLAVEGNDKILIGTTWKNYEGEIVEPTDPPAPGTQRTIYLDNSTYNFETPYAYVWTKGTKNGPATWPGTAMHASSNLGSNIYEITVDAVYDCVIFSNNGSNQTNDLKDIPYLKAMYKNNQWVEVKDDVTIPTESTTPTSTTEPSSAVVTHKVLIGDVNLDGKINIKDVAQLQRHLADMAVLTGDAFIAADTDRNNSLNIKDATYIQLYLAEYENYESVATYVEVGDPTQPTTATTPTTPTTQPAPTTQPVSGKTINVGVVYYLPESGYQVHWWNSSQSGDIDLTSTGQTASKSVGSSYWSGAAQNFNMYTAVIPSDAIGFKIRNGSTWYGSDGNALTQSSAYIFEYGGSYNAYYE